MKCQLKYRWVKLPRACLPQGKGVLGQWARLAARAAYRKGVGLYCGFENPVEPGMWAGGVVGLKSILGTKSRKAALEALEQLQKLGYLSYSLDSTTKKLEYELIYLTYIVPEKLSHTDLLFRLDLSSRQYYRLREEAISIISIRLWSVPEEELGRLVGLVEVLGVR